MRASELAELLDAELEGGADPEITGAAPLEHAGPSDLTFVAQARYLPRLTECRAGLFLVAEALVDRAQDALADRPRVVTGDVHAALAVLLPALYPEPRPVPGLHPTAVVHEGADVGVDVVVGPHAVIGAGARLGDRARVGAHVVVGEGCQVAEDVVLHPHVTLYPRTRIGARSILHAGVRVGVDGFGYAPVGGVPTKVPQVGGCVVGADVEIGANTTVDRGSLGVTEIGDHVKIDNLVHIAHNVRIGAGSIVVAQVGVAGSTRIGRGVTVAGQAGIGGHAEIGDGATVAARAGVFGDVPPGETWSGYPARPHREAMRREGAVSRLPELRKRVRELEDRLNKDGE